MAQYDLSFLRSRAFTKENIDRRRKFSKNHKHVTWDKSHEIRYKENDFKALPNKLLLISGQSRKSCLLVLSLVCICRANANISIFQAAQVYRGHDE